MSINLVDLGPVDRSRVLVALGVDSQLVARVVGDRVLELSALGDEVDESTVLGKRDVLSSDEGHENGDGRASVDLLLAEVPLAGVLGVGAADGDVGLLLVLEGDTVARGAIAGVETSVLERRVVRAVDGLIGDGEAKSLETAGVGTIIGDVGDEVSLVVGNIGSSAVDVEDRSGAVVLVLGDGVDTGTHTERAQPGLVDRGLEVGLGVTNVNQEADTLGAVDLRSRVGRGRSAGRGGSKASNGSESEELHFEKLKKG